MTSRIQKRRQARFLLTQALYQWHVSENPIAEILVQFQASPQFHQADQAYFMEALQAITQHVEQFDHHYQIYLDRSLAELDPIERAILRLAVYELAMRLDIPYRVIINEALELAKTFGATDSHKYINGVLDKVAKDLRKMEMV